MLGSNGKTKKLKYFLIAVVSIFTMIIAGLCAEGQTEITEIHHILRGYENIIGKFQNLGANIEYVKTEDDE